MTLLTADHARVVSPRLGTTPVDLSQPTTRLLFVLLLADLAFVGLHLGHMYVPRLERGMYSITAERGYAEMFQYIKAFWIGALLVLLAYQRRAWSYLPWAMVFFYLMVDDATKIHEDGGGAVTDWLGLQPAFGLRAKDFGELIVSAGIGAVLLAMVVLAYWRSGVRERAHARVLLGLMALLAFFGVGLDMVHSIFRDTLLNVPLAMVEDGGEMVVLSLALWAVFRFGGPSAAAGRAG